MIFRAFEKFSGMTKADAARPGGGTEKCRIEGKNRNLLLQPGSPKGKIDLQSMLVISCLCEDDVLPYRNALQKFKIRSTL